MTQKVTISVTIVDSPWFRKRSIEQMTKNMGSWGVSTEDFVAIDGEGHYWIAFNKKKLNQQGEPTIAYIASEDGDCGSITSCTIAESFQSFLKALESDDNKE